MARKKSTQRKIKIDSKGNGHKESHEKTMISPDQQKECDGEKDKPSSQKSDQGKLPLSSTKPLNLQVNTFKPMKIKQERRLSVDSNVCSQTNLQHGYKESTIILPSVKQEQDSGSIPISVGMDLGSHLHLGGSHVGLTWSHLMEPSNYPKPYEAGGKKDTPIPVSSSRHGSPSNDDQLSLKDHAPGSNISSVSNRFSSSLGNSAKMHLNEGAAGGTGILDLSKKALPPEIRRMLASKYGVPKRNDEGSSMVPNFNKSRSRFTIGSKKTTSSDTDTTVKMDTGVSPPLTEQDGETSCPETTTGTTQLSVPTTSSTAQHVSLDNQSTKSDNLKYRGTMLDLASHYGNLIKDTTPRPGRTSRSPHLDEPTVSPGPQNLGEAMIDLGSVSRLNELRPPTLRRSGEPMINLSAMETPTSPLSPSFRPVSFGVFPNPTYRHNSMTQSYRPRSTPASRPPRHTASPRLPFQSHHSFSPDPRPAAGSMIDLGNFGKGNEFPSMVASRPSLPSQVTRRIMPKRRHSLDSHSLREVVKRPCTTERKKDEISIKVESNMKLNINDLLQLEQEEQKYIKDLSFIQNKVTDIRFKIQMRQQELEALQSSEVQIKQHIDIVRTKRVKILKDAQDREGSVGSSSRSHTSDAPEKSVDRIQAVVAERESGDRITTTYNRAGYQAGLHCGQADDFRGGNEKKRKVEVVTDVEAEEKELTRGSERLLSRRVEIDRFGGYHYVSRLHAGGHNEQEVTAYPTKGIKSRRLDESQNDKVTYSENCDVTENGDGTLLLRQHTLNHRMRKGSMLNEVTLSDEVNGPEHNGPKQFLGCLEISSTTPEVEDDQISPENERKTITKNVSCDTEVISSTSLDENVDEAPNLSEMEFIGHTDAVCAIIPFRKNLFSASADRTVRLFDLKTGECTNTFQGHQKGINCIQIASDVGNRDRLFTGSNDQTVRAYNVKSGTCTHKFSFRGRVMCLHIAFGKLFVGLSSGFVAVIDLKSNQCIDQFNCHEPSRISCLASASNGQRSLLCTGSFDSTITIRDQNSGRLLRTIKDHKLTVLCMQVTNNMLFSGSADTAVQSHNINTGELVQSYVGHSMSVSGLQAIGGTQGGVLVTSSLDRIIRCFDITSGDLLQLYGGNNDMIFSLAVCRDMIYSGCRDGKLSGIKLDLRKYHCCKWDSCSLKFGLLHHLKQHVQDHANQTYVFNTCLWENCTHKFHRGKQIDVMQAAVEHIISHVPDHTET